MVGLTGLDSILAQQPTSTDWWLDRGLPLIILIALAFFAYKQLFPWMKERQNRKDDQERLDREQRDKERRDNATVLLTVLQTSANAAQQDAAYARKEFLDALSHRDEVLNKIVKSIEGLTEVVHDLKDEVGKK